MAYRPTSYLVLVYLIVLTCCNGCVSYNHTRPVVNGMGDYIGDEKTRSYGLLATAEALGVKSEVVDENSQYMRSMDIESLKFEPDNEAIKAITDGIVEGVVTAIGAP